LFIPLPEGARRVPMSEIEQPQAFERLAPPIATPDEAAPVPTLQSMLSTAELSRRPSRPPDHAAENRAMVALARELATSPEGILQKLAETALALCGAHSAGLSLLEDGDRKRNFHWRAIAGAWAPHLNGGTPREFGPCGTVLDRNVALMCSHPERDFPYFGDVQPLLEEALLIPFYVNGEAVGTIWVVSHDKHRRFDAEDLRVMTNLSIFAAAAYQTSLSLNAAQRIIAIVESSDDAIISKDLNGVITSWNRGAERLFGYTAEEVIGKPVTILMPPDRRDEEPPILERIRRGERIEHYETVRRRKYGGDVDISLSVSPIKNAHGIVVGASKIARDISDRKRSEAQITILAREAEHRAKNVLATVQATVHLSQSDTPEGSRTQSRGASWRWQMSMRCSSSRAGLEPSCAAWSRKSCRLMPGTWKRARRSTTRPCYWSRMQRRRLRSLCTSWRPTRPSTGHCPRPKAVCKSSGRALQMDGLSCAGPRPAARGSIRRRAEALARASWKA
jgi:PAS domain S-box-containing protein